MVIFDAFESLFVFIRHLHGGVDGVVGQIEKKTFLLMAINESDRFARKGLGQVLLFIHLVCAAPNWIEAVGLGIHIRM